MMIVLNACIFLVLTAGHAEWIVTVVNRMHARRILEARLRHLRHAHDVAILLFPFILLGFVGFSGPRLLLGGSWNDVPTGWMAYFALCAAGAVKLTTSALRWRYRRIPSLQLSNHSWTIDIAQRLGRRPVGEGPYRILTHVPGNEIFQVEVSEKRYQLPRLPKEWHELSILHLTDTHFIGTIERSFFEEVATLSQELRPDMIVFTGDLLDRQELIEWLPTTLGRLSAPLGCYYILGNHDWSLDPQEMRAKLNDLGWRDLAGTTTELERDGKTIVMGGSEMPWMGQHPEFHEKDGHAFRILLSHTPDNLPWAREQQIDLMLSGHNHGGQVILPLLGPIYSPSRYGVRYAGGVFHEEPTLLYVSRGLSAKHALRWNCPPELTKLVLESPAAGG